ncbi:MAG: hypothetical protein CVV15_12030 [Gammaproteobacteria bacterium HGW-Gammaproteobacteria-5]|jgi:hypothetical protein|nr:MAG: hypothetical protein CVV15_12030 [Gammaproteobacteria bacterium HGW-Gammaproteobacteria-5]
MAPCEAIPRLHFVGQHTDTAQATHSRIATQRSQFSATLVAMLRTCADPLFGNAIAMTLQSVIASAEGV